MEIASNEAFDFAAVDDLGTITQNDTYLQKHIAAIESDAGGFTPRAFGVDDTNAVKNFKKWEPLYQNRI